MVELEPEPKLFSQLEPDNVGSTQFDYPPTLNIVLTVTDLLFYSKAHYQAAPRARRSSLGSLTRAIYRHGVSLHFLI